MFLNVKSVRPIFQVWLGALSSMGTFVVVISKSNAAYQDSSNKGLSLLLAVTIKVSS